MAIMMLMMLFAGCAAEDATNNQNIYPSPMLCQSDAQCGPQLVCRAGFCDAKQNLTRQLEFTFIPTNDSKYLPQRTGLLAITPEDELVFEVQSSLKVQGNITRSNAPGLLNGTLIFERSNERYEKIYTRQARITQGEFAVDLVPGTYDLTFIPESRALPSKTWSKQTFELNSDFTRALPTLKTVTGTVSYRILGADEQDIPLLVAGARVIAVSKETGQLSTIAQTDDSGFFELAVWPDSGKYDIVIAPNTPLSLVPQVVFENAIDTQSGKDDAQNLSLNIGQLPQNTNAVSLSFDKTQLDALDFSPADLRIVLRAPTDKGQLQLSTRFGDINTTSEDWTLNMDVLPLVYDIELIPPASSRFARTTLRQDMRASTRTYVLQLDEKRPIQAQLLYTDSMGTQQPLRDATIRIQPNQDKESDAYELTTDTDGRIYTFVDNTTYDIVVIPPPQLGLPRATYTIDGANSTEQSVTWTMPQPKVLLGAVYDDQGTGQSGMTIQVHEGGKDKRRLIAEGRTIAGGTFAIVIPAPKP